MTDATISVIIPCYNQAHFLAEAIDSVLAQTVPATEIIVIDDGSPDDTEKVVRGYPSVRYLRQPNQGQSIARNRGIQATTGRYIIFLDADDRLLPQNIELALHAFAEAPSAGFVCGDYEVIGLRDLHHTHDCRPLPDHYGTLLQVRANFITLPASVMFRREALNAVGNWRVGLRNNTDIDLFLRIALRYPILCHHQVVAQYRRHPGQVTKRCDLMLNAIMTVYRLHWPHISQRPEYLAAYRNGLELTRSVCASHLLWQIADHARNHRWRIAGQGLVAMLRYFPSDLFRFLIAKLGRLITRPRGSCSQLPS